MAEKQMLEVLKCIKVDKSTRSTLVDFTLAWEAREHIAGSPSEIFG